MSSLSSKDTDHPLVYYVILCMFNLFCVILILVLELISHTMQVKPKEEFVSVRREQFNVLQFRHLFHHPLDLSMYGR